MNYPNERRARTVVAHLIMTVEILAWGILKKHLKIVKAELQTAYRLGFDDGFRTSEKEKSK